MEKISYQELVELLSQGREIEFKYKNRMFSITNTPNGYSLCEFYSYEPQTFPEADELLDKATIDGYKLSDIWDKVLVDYIY